MVLENHARTGKKFVPAFKNAIPLTEVHYVEWILPELLWIAYFLDEFGDREGVRVVSDVVRTATAEFASQSHAEFAFASSFCGLNTRSRKQFVRSLRDQNLLTSVRKGLAPFVRVFPKDNPFAFIVGMRQQSKQASEDDVNRARRLVDEVFDRRSVRAVVLQSVVTYSDFLVGKMKIAPHLQLPNLEAIHRDFDSDEAQRAAAFVRSTVSQVYMMSRDSLGTAWSTYFWNRGLEIRAAETGLQVPSESPIDSSGYRFLADYERICIAVLNEVWTKLPKDLSTSEEVEVIGALLARQCELTVKLAKNLDLWEWGVGPLLLRTMADAYITLAWILCEPLVRARKFIDYGLGQQKLQVEHYRDVMKGDIDESDRDDIANMIAVHEAWIDSQHFSFLQDVNIGSWSGASTRAMAEDAKCLDLYRFAYTPYSFCAHNSWNHIERMNSLQSTDPLHKFIRQPFIMQHDVEPTVFMNSTKYFQKALKAVCHQYDLSLDSPLPLDWAAEHISHFLDSVTEVRKSDDESSGHHEE